VVCVVLASGKSPAADYLAELKSLREKKKSEPESSAFARFAILFQQMANYGHVSPKRFGPEMDGFYAFKHEVRNRQIRFPCFQDGHLWVLTHGFQKPGAKKNLGDWPPAQKARAREIRAEYFERKQALQK